MTTRRRLAGAAAAGALAALVTVGAGGGAHAAPAQCTYKGRKYAQGVAVCQSGLVQLCMGGAWQDQGRFCSAPDGTPLGKPFLGPGQVDVEPEPAPPPPAR
jgi:hypothetical protein